MDLSGVLRPGQDLVVEAPMQFVEYASQIYMCRLVMVRYRKSIGHFTDFAFVKRMQTLNTTQVIIV